MNKMANGCVKRRGLRQNHKESPHSWARERQVNEGNFQRKRNFWGLWLKRQIKRDSTMPNDAKRRWRYFSG